jgi:hypothetical protein
VRIQEPSWIDVAGIGVEFIELSPGAERILARLPETDPTGQADGP